MAKAPRDVEKIYSTPEVVAKLRRLADAWENGVRIGLLAWIWPAVTGVLSEAVMRDRSPAFSAPIEGL